jgi:hypothetical protein
MKTEAKVREDLAPGITTKILSRCRGGITPADAEILAHDIIATVGAAFLEARGYRSHDWPGKAGDQT